MLSYPLRQYIIVCEGDSENAYIQKLMRFLRDDKENTYDLEFISKSAGGGHYNAVVKKYRFEGKNNPKADIYIWIDFDIYKRNDGGDWEKYQQNSKKMPDFLFSKMNFEDFLVLHFDDELLKKWEEICQKNNHIENPMKEDVYMPFLKKLKNNIFLNYKKGEMPIEITKESLANLFRHNNGGSIFSKTNEFPTFASFLEKKIQESSCL